MAQPPVIVLGCGIIGLTTSLRLQSSNPSRPVIIVASHLPSDPLSPHYASSTAGAHHLSFAPNSDLRQRHFDARTFEVMWSELESPSSEGEGLMKCRQTEYFDGTEKHLELLAGLPEFVEHDPAVTLPPFAAHSISFTSLTMDPPLYLATLLNRFLAAGGKVIRTPVLKTLGEVFAHLPEGTGKPEAVVVCVGLGARALGEVEDEEVYPTRGQVICLEAPWQKSGSTLQIGSLHGGEGGRRTYIIPRVSGEVIVGGTREVDDWNEKEDPETTTAILQRAFLLCPTLAPPGTPNPTWECLLPLVKRVSVGFRPTRKSGVRIEESASPLSDPANGEGEREGGGVRVVYNYGHGGYGWQSCWGCAEAAVEVLDGREAPRVGGWLEGAAGYGRGE